jgi:tRNA pseudouridine55 synthase
MKELLHGVIVVDKPVGPTSFAVVRQARQVTGARKVGHGGTLDPLASGVLPICFGEGTKVAQFLLDADKEYEATIQFGTETETDDAAGPVTSVKDTDHLTEGLVGTAMASFLGAQTQIPPMYSALKRDGRPLYDYARAGETVERQPRKIRILAFELLRFQPPRTPTTALPAGPEALVRVRCSKGTYIRTLARDLGACLGTAAHLSALRRTRSGPFDLTQAIPPADLASPAVRVITPADALSHLPAIRISAPWVRVVMQGKPVLWGDVEPPTAPVGSAGAAPEAVPEFSSGAASDIASAADALTRLLTTAGELVAVARRGLPSERIRTLRVFGVRDRLDDVALVRASGAVNRGPTAPALTISGSATHPDGVA